MRPRTCTISSIPFVSFNPPKRRPTQARAPPAALREHACKFYYCGSLDMPQKQCQLKPQKNRAVGFLN